MSAVVHASRLELRLAEVAEGVVAEAVEDVLAVVAPLLRRP